MEEGNLIWRVRITTGNLVLRATELVGPWSSAAVESLRFSPSVLGVYSSLALARTFQLFSRVVFVTLL
jgi:hypothetical protein